MEEKEKLEKGRPGRPRKSNVRKPRTVWLTDTEYKTLFSKAEKANLDFSKYAREILLNRKPVFYGEGYKSIFNELHKQGVNINQAVKSLNEIAITQEMSRNPEHFAELLLRNQGDILTLVEKLLKQ